MKYYVVSDIHSFYHALKATLDEKGFFTDTNPHKLIICGDIFDRGEESQQLQTFILDLMQKDQVILIRGNHEDLALQLLNQWHSGSYRQYFHHANGTIDTVLQLTNMLPDDLWYNSEAVGRAFLKTPYIQKIIPAMVDYFEAGHYIFTHGWIPCTPISISSNAKEYVPIANWRNANKGTWDKARWINGMEAAHNGILASGKTIVCGHWHCSFGHANYEHNGGEFDNNPIFTPYYGNGIIALDACTAFSGVVNCITIDIPEDEIVICSTNSGASCETE